VLKKIILENFRKHEHSVFFLSNGLTVFKGSSYAGKSAVVKAVKWALTNRPPGNSIRRRGSDFVKVTLEFDDCIIIRGKNKDFNGYKLFKNGKWQEFNAIKLDVPKEVIDASNLLQENIQGQFDKYFMLQDSAGEVAAKWNEAADMEIISKITKEAAAQARKITENMAFSESRIQETNEKLNSFKNLENIRKIWNDFCDKKNEFKVMFSLYNSLSNILKSAKQCIDRIEFLFAEIKPEDRLNKFEKKYLQYKEEERENALRVNRTKFLLSDYDICNNKILILSEKIKPEKKFNEFEDGYLKCKEVQSFLKLKIEKIKSLLEDYNECVLILNKNKLLLNEIKEKVKPIFDNMKVCFFCKSEINKDHSKKLFNEWVNE
jgi:hypothetical protein